VTNCEPTWPDDQMFRNGSKSISYAVEQLQRKMNFTSQA
jgi:hypothetical protein